MSGEKEYPMPEKNECGGYYCSEEHGHIDCQLVPCKSCGKRIKKGSTDCPHCLATDFDT